MWYFDSWMRLAFPRDAKIQTGTWHHQLHQQKAINSCTQSLLWLLQPKCSFTENSKTHQVRAKITVEMQAAAFGLFRDSVPECTEPGVQGLPLAGQSGIPFPPELLPFSYCFSKKQLNIGCFSLQEPSSPELCLASGPTKTVFLSLEKKFFVEKSTLLEKTKNLEITPAEDTNNALAQ